MTKVTGEIVTRQQTWCQGHLPYEKEKMVVNKHKYKPLVVKSSYK